MSRKKKKKKVDYIHLVALLGPLIVMLITFITGEINTATVVLAYTIYGSAYLITAGFDF